VYIYICQIICKISSKDGKPQEVICYIFLTPTIYSAKTALNGADLLDPLLNRRCATLRGRASTGAARSLFAIASNGEIYRGSRAHLQSSTVNISYPDSPIWPNEAARFAREKPFNLYRRRRACANHHPETPSFPPATTVVHRAYALLVVVRQLIHFLGGHGPCATRTGG
jgi:hypothetical protein